VHEDRQLIGRIRLASEHTSPLWLRTVAVTLPGPPSGDAGSLDQAKQRFATAWATFKDLDGLPCRRDRQTHELKLAIEFDGVIVDGVRQYRRATGLRWLASTAGLALRSRLLGGVQPDLHQPPDRLRQVRQVGFAPSPAIDLFDQAGGNHHVQALDFIVELFRHWGLRFLLRMTAIMCMMYLSDRNTEDNGAGPTQVTSFIGSLLTNHVLAVVTVRYRADLIMPMLTA
jgi:hypothetical protein